MPTITVDGKKITADTWEDVAKAAEALKGSGGKSPGAPAKAAKSFEEYLAEKNGSTGKTSSTPGEPSKLLRNPKAFFEALIEDPETALLKALTELNGGKDFMQAFNQSAQIAQLSLQEARRSRFEALAEENSKLDQVEATRVIDGIISKEHGGIYTRANLKAAFKKAYENGWLAKPEETPAPAAKTEVKTEAKKPDFFKAPVELMDLDASEGEESLNDLSSRLEKFAAKGDLNQVEQVLNAFGETDFNEENAEAIFANLPTEV